MDVSATDIKTVSSFLLRLLSWHKYVHGLGETGARQNSRKYPWYLTAQKLPRLFFSLYPLIRIQTQHILPVKPVEWSWLWVSDRHVSLQIHITTAHRSPVVLTTHICIFLNIWELLLCTVQNLHQMVGRSAGPLRCYFLHNLLYLSVLRVSVIV